MQRARTLFTKHRTKLLGGVVVLCLVVMIAVFATSDERTIHILPTNVSSDHWMKDTQALEQVLGTQAVFSDFNTSNSAYIIFDGTGDTAASSTTDEAPEADSSTTQGSWGDNGTSSATVDAPVVPPSTDSTGEDTSAHDSTGAPDVPPAPLPDESAFDYLNRFARDAVMAVAHAQDVPGTPTPDTEHAEVPAPDAADAGSGDTTPAPEIPVGTGEPAATTPDVEPSSVSASDTANAEDVRLCVVLGIACHTIQFTGFDIGSVLSDHVVKSYTLRLSLGARTEGESFTPDKLVVRYFYKNAWHLAGELVIDHEISNFDEGGHLAFPLPNLEGWDALKDFKVELEYVRHGTSRNELYLDSVWVDTTYEANASDEAPVQAPNILQELAVLEDSGRPDLLLADGKRIELSKTDAQPGDELVVRSDKDVYNGLTSGRAYFSVTNTSDREESFALTTRSGTQADVVAVYERVKNKPTVSDVPAFSDVGYYCEGGWDITDVISSGAWQNTSDASSTDADPATGDSAPDTGSSDIASTTDTAPDATHAQTVPSTAATTYTCTATGETQACTSFNDDRTNCIVGNERVSVNQNTTYGDSWRDIALEAAADGSGGGGFFSWLGLGKGSTSSPATRLPNGHTSRDRMPIMPHQTLFFAVDLSYAVQRAGEFSFEITGEEADASRSVWWRSAFAHRIPVTLVRAGAEHETGTSSDGVPELYEVRVTRDHPEVFESSSLDGRDVRFYDASLRLELPSKELEYSYVDQRARYAVELGGTRGAASTTIYAYFGNEFVDAGERVAAPSITDDPIAYVGLAEPRDGAVVTVTSERDLNVLSVPDKEPQDLAYGETTSVLVPDTDTMLALRGPAHVTIAESEWAGGTRSFELALPSDMHTTATQREDGRTSYLLERYVLHPTVATFGVTEDLPLPAVGVFEPQAFKDMASRTNYLRDLKGPAYQDFTEALKDFEIGDDVAFKLHYRPQKGAVSRFFRGLFRQRLSVVNEVRMFRGGELIPDAHFNVVYGDEGYWTIRLTDVPRDMAPGKYTVELAIDEAGTQYTDSFDFYWGVLVVNTPRSIYERGDQAEFHMAALDDKGDTLCDAELRLVITEPSGNAVEVPVALQPTCGPNNVTDEPDYKAFYTPQETGTYTMTLTHVNLNGEIVHQVNDSFEVRERQPYTIERHGATRIWPKAPYVMELAVTAMSDGPADVIEAVPERFKLLDVGDADTTVWGGAKRIIWHTNLEKGHTKIFRYEYDAPDISPYLYLLGPAEVRAGEGIPFTEARTWKLASDALGQYTEVVGSFTLGATGWNTVSLSGSPYNVPANAIVEIFVANTANANTVTAGVRQQTSALSRYLPIDRSDNASGVVGYSTFVTASATSSIEAYTSNTGRSTFYVLGYWTSGTYTETFNQIDPNLTDNTWGSYNLSSYGVADANTVEFVLANYSTTDYNAGVRTAGSSVDRRVQLHGRTTNNNATFATMLVKASTSNSTINMNAEVEGANGASIDYYMMGYWSTNPTGLVYQERYDDLGGPSSATTWTDVALDSYGGYKNNIAEVLMGYSSDIASNNTLGARTKGSSNTRTLTLAYANGAGTGWNTGRVHVPTDSTASSTIQYYSASTTADNYRLLGYWKASNLSPETMTFYDVPFNNEKTGSSTPYFDFSTLDPDGTSDLTYEIQWDDDADLDTAPLGDEVSTSTNSYFVNTASSSDLSPFVEGNKIRFTIQSALTTGTTYYWRVRAKDDSGSNSYGDWSTTQSFTYVENTSPKAWYQTEDAQFDGDTKSSTETYGSNNVRIATTPPVGALVAYGDGSVSTPRYRIWDGSAWGSELSASSSSGTINWTVLRAGTTRNEYMLGTQTATGTIKVQIYNAASSTWGNALTLTTAASSSDRRPFDIAYQSVSGDAIVAYCMGNNAQYKVWNGTSWSATSSISFQFNASCNWISLAGSRTRDDVVLLAQANSTNTTGDFEAQVYSNSAWGNSWTGGNNTAGEEMFERMAVAWEDSGDEAVVVVGNGGTANFISATWNSANGAWTANANRTTQDDFEWGQLVADDGTDNLGLCYIDEDNQVHIAKWTGSSNAWDTYDAAGDQITATGLTNGGTDYHARGVTCQYETTSGRDGYLMVPFSNTTAGQYRVWNGSTLATAANVSTIEDSWFANSARTGDGKILTIWRDNTNARYDFSYWNASAWSARQALGSTMSDTSEPYGESMAIAAQRYQSASGAVTSPIVDFDLVPGRSSWGEVLWSTTETAGTDVKLYVYYATTTASCNVLVPDAALSGNSSGYDVTASPLDISNLSTSTYNMICIKAALTSTVVSSPTLDDWTVSWQRRPYLAESRYLWYVNDASSLTPSDVWPSGADALAENTAIPTSFAPNVGDVLRLRIAIKDTNVALSASASAFKLQWAEGSVCSASLSWSDVGAAGSSTPWRGYDNTSLSDGATVPSLLLSTADSLESYEEGNPTVSNPNSIAVGNEGEWDFVLQHNATSSTNYCFRLINTDGTQLNAYDVYPQLVTNAPPSVPEMDFPFDNEAVASTSPWFEFVATDLKNDDLHYQVQVDNDIAFGSPELDENSLDNYTKFSNLVTPADKSPYNAWETIRYVPTTALTNGTTYWWRVRARDPNGSGDWSDWSDPSSFTASTSVTATTWHQTTLDQFSPDTLEQTEATSTNSIVLTPPATVGTATSPAIYYSWVRAGNAWGSLSFTNTGTVTYRVEYYSNGTWSRIPDSALSGNSTGFTTGPVSLLGLDPTTYNTIRIVAVFSGASPTIYDWTVSWGYAVAQPTQLALFDNEKTGTTTPSFRFYSTDPQNDKLQYQIQWSTSYGFTSSTTRTSGVDSGFANTASSTESSPYTSGNTIRFTTQSADALTNGTTYWWRVRARDPSGANVWSVWSPLRSFTVDTSVTVSTWFQTTDDQFSTDALSNTEVYGSNNVRITTTIREALLAYAEGVVQTPRYRIWNGSSWGTEKSASNIGERMYWAQVAAAPTRDEYTLMTGGLSGAVKAQIYSGSSQTWGSAVDMATPASALRRGFDIAYETSSGDGMAVSCYGADATYRIWNGSSWSASSTINLSFTQNCEWITLASDPTSDEIILVARANPAQTPYAFEMQVWNGSSWGNATTAGQMDATDAENIGMDVEYEESGGDAVVVVSNGTNANFHYRTWNGSSWSATSSVTTADDLEVPKIRRDVGTDNMVMCYVAQNLGIYYTTWNGSSWAAPTTLSIDSNSKDGSDSFDCGYETVGSRDGYIMFPYTDAVTGFYRYWDGATLQPETTLSTFTDSWSVQSTRVGDGRILTAFWDDANTNIDVTDWNGTAWTTKSSVETNVSALATNNVPMSITARRYPSVTSGSVVSSAIDFFDGSGPRWDYATWTDSTPGGSDIKYQVEYSTDDGSTWSLVPDADLPGNSTGTSTGPISLQNLPYTTYNLIRLVANFTCNAGTCPTLSDWTVAWSAGITVSGTAQLYDRTTNATSGTVAVAVNGVLQSGKTGTIVGGTWSIADVTTFVGDTITVFIDGAPDASEAVGVTKYDGIGNITNMKLFSRHLSIGSDDATTTTNANLALYDYSTSGDEDVFFDVDSGNDLYVCATGSGTCSDAVLYIRNGYTYRADSSNSGTLYAYDVVNNGTTTADSNTFYVSGSWDDNSLFTGAGSSLIFTATSGSKTFDTVWATSSSYNVVTFGQGSGSATWTLTGSIDINGVLQIAYGTVNASTSSLYLADALTITSTGAFTKGTGTTTFDGSATGIITDSTASPKQDLGKVYINGSSKTVRLASAARVTDLTIASANTFDVTASNQALEVTGDFRNSGTFSAQSGTVTFTATTTGRVIDPGSSSFHNLTVNGAGGNWAFVPNTVTIGNNLTVATGTLTLTSGTTTVSGNINNSGGAFVHNNGTVELTGTGAKTIYQNNSPFYDLTVNGSGSWSFTDTNATSSGSVRLLNGTLTFPSSTYAVGKSLLNTGGTVQPNNGTLRFTSATTETIQLNGSKLYGLTVAGSSGSFTLADMNLTASGTVRFDNGTTTLPSGTFSIGGSFIATSGTFNANGGTVSFIATTTGFSITPGTSSFSNVSFLNSSGGWTVTANATSTGSWNIASSSSYVEQSGTTLEVKGTFSNSVPSVTTWTGSTLYLNSGSAYTVGSKTQAPEGYGTLRIGVNTDIKLWQSSSTAYSVDPTGSLYSMDHNAVDGELYIWGEYLRTTGTDYWSYATDFDGTSLGGGSRQVHVYLANGTSAQFTNSTLQMLGSASASTTIANQGSGTYALSIVSGTMNAQYYTVTNGTTSGLSILGSSTVTSLSDGDFTLTVNGGTMLTVSSTTIDANPVLQPQRVSFSTSSGVTSGYNVTASGTATSYWWFKNSYGNYDGEAFDNDPVAGPGSIRWDDSGYTISIGGTAYAGEGSGGASPACDGSTQRIRLVVNGTTPYTASCNASTGVFTFPAVTYTGDVSLIAYIDGYASARAATVSRTPTGNITGFDLYQNRVIVRHEDTAALTVNEMLAYDSDQDADIPFDAESGSLAVQPEFGLYVWTGKIFAPGGNVTLNSGGSGASYDGSLRLATSSTFTAAGTESHTIGGSWTADSGSTFTAASSTATFTATTSGKTIAPQSAFNLVVFNGSNGGWSITSPMTSNGSTTVTAGTVSGTSNLTVASGALSGNGTVSMTGGTVTLQGGGLFGGSSAWTFANLTFGNGSAGTSIKNGSGAVSMTGTLTVATSHQLRAGSADWTLTGSGSAFVSSGTFTAETSTTTFAGTSAMNVPALAYNNLVLAPASGGSPTYTLDAGNLTAATLTVGNGTNAVTANVNANDPLVTVSGNVRINANATYAASNANDLVIGGSYTNSGTFTSNGGGVVFNSSDTGEIVTPGNSSFHHLTFNSAGGGWTIAANATTTGNFSLSSATSFTQTSGTQLTVQGSFTNSVGGSATTWSNTTLYLNSGTTYTMNTKSAGGDTYGTLRVGANTDVGMWNSTSTAYTVDSSGSLYSMDHNAVDGALYIWGDYVRSSGSDYWSYATDFDGTNLASTSSQRPVSVYLAANATTTLSGGSLEILGAAGATTTIQNQGSGTYALQVTGGTFNAQYYKIRNINSTGLSLSGSPTITQLGNADLQLAINAGTTMTVAGSVIDANPVKTWQGLTFATSSGVATGTNVTATGSTVSSWRFIPGSGILYGEPYDNDPAGDPGYLIWSDSAASVTISGKVYSDEGVTVSPICNGSSPVVRIVIQGANPQTTSCAAGTGLYSFSGISYSPGDSVIVYIDGTSTKAANVTYDPITSISDMHLYANRVIVRHEQTAPLSIASMAVYDSSDDTDIPFTAATGTPHTLSLPANFKLIVWTGKTFKPGGNITLNSGGSGTSYDGTFELQNSASLVASTTVAESHAIGGSWLAGTSSSFTAGLSTVTFTATTSGKTVRVRTSPFYKLTFNGTGGAWTFAERDATTTSDFTITTGSVTLGTSTLAVGGSFVNAGTLSAASTSITFSSAAPATVTFGGASVGSLTFAGSGAHTMTDTNATSTGSVTIAAGSVSLPSGIFAIANGFVNSGGSFTHGGTLRFYGSLAAQNITFGNSTLNNLTTAGSGSWSITDTAATTTGSVTVTQGSLTAPSAVLAIGGSFANSGTYSSNGGLTYFYATTTGKTITSGTASFADVLFSGVGGGWTVASSATSTGYWFLNSGASFTMATGTTLEVRGTFANLIGGASTTWNNSTLYLNASGTSYTVNTKSAGGDQYANLLLGANTNVRLWGSAASTTTVPSTSSLYSMNNNATSGYLYIWGSYTRSSGSDYWSYATDFDGTALGGSSRQVTVRIASSSSVTYTGGSLDIVGSAGATTTVAVQGSGAYSIALSGGTLNASYYSFRNLDANGLSLSGALTVSSLSYGDFELSANAGTLLKIASSTIDQNPSKTITGARFATSTGIATGTNATLIGATTNLWRFTSHTGNLAGESYDYDGSSTCGALRWDDSTCLEVSQTHYRFRADDGGGGAPNSEWYDSNWLKRKRINVTNPNASALTNYPVKFDLTYDSDMLSNFADLRFTDSSGTTSIPFWIETYTTSATATVWVKVPTLPASDSTYIYAYYSNAAASSGSNGSSTFSFFDDFEDNNISEYSGDTSYFNTTGSLVKHGSYGLAAASGYTNQQTPDGIYRTATTFSQGSTVAWHQYIDGTKDDEACTLFGVQSPGSNNQNYAVCLDQYPSDKLVLSKNVSSNDTSGTVLASTTVSYSSQWYDVRVDWLTSNTINVYVYTSSGSLFATTSATDSTYTSGGMGFSFWYQYGGWDDYTVRPYAASAPTTYVGLEQGKDGASWKTTQDTAYSQAQNENFRVRFSIENTGTQITGQQWRLQYADRTGYGTCAAVPSVLYNDVPNAAGCGTTPVCMVTTSQYADGDPTQQLLNSSTYLSFTQGALIESPSNQTSAMTLPQNTMTEVEYAIELTPYATADSYCMRTTNGGVAIDSYQHVAEVTAKYEPVISNWKLNNDHNIALIEGQTVTVHATGTVTDLNGWSDIVYATSTIYRSGVGVSCAANDNNCYRLTSLDCPLTNCSGNSCTIDCTASLQYFTDPTDVGTYSAEQWFSDVYVEDTTGYTATSTSVGVDVLTLFGLTVTSGSINYGLVPLDQDTGNYNATSTLRNTGNAAVDVGLQGTDLTNGPSSIPVGNEKYATSTFTYSGCVICSALSGSPSTVEVNLPKPTSTSTAVTDNLYWGIYVPTGVAGTTHQGQNTFYAVAD